MKPNKEGWFLFGQFNPYDEQNALPVFVFRAEDDYGGDDIFRFRDEYGHHVDVDETTDDQWFGEIRWIKVS